MTHIPVWGPILAVLNQLPTSDEVLHAFQLARFSDFGVLSEEDDYSHRTRKRAYMRAVQRKIPELSENEQWRKARIIAKEINRKSTQIQEQFRQALADLDFAFDGEQFRALEIQNYVQAPQKAGDQNLEATSRLSGKDSSNVRPSRRPLRVFLCHSSGDKPAVRNLCRRLRADGFSPWLDEEDLLPGQDWTEEIPKAVRRSDVVIVCLSKSSVTKEGYVQKEIRYAIDVEEEKPEGTIFIVPVRLEEVNIPERLKKWHYASLFQNDGYERLLNALKSRAVSLGIVFPTDSTANSNQEAATSANTSDKRISDFRVVGELGGEFLLYPQTERARQRGGPPFMAPGHAIAFRSSAEVIQYIEVAHREGFTVEGLEVFSQRSGAASAGSDWISQHLARQQKATLREAAFAGNQLEMLERFRTNAPASWEAIAEAFNVVVRQCREAGKQLVVAATPTRIQVSWEGRSLEALASLEFDPTNGRVRYICPVPSGQAGVPRLGEFQIRANGVILGQQTPNGPVVDFTPANLVQFVLEPVLFSK